jgi:ubiquinone/menaquinone biosynthesis C-methylase UbiE
VVDPRFRPDLFRGTARAYDQFRLPYPDALIDTLARCCPAAGTGTMLDLACGPGQLGFALRGRFREVWAADVEPDMIALVEAKARAAGFTTVRPVLSAAEDLIAPAGSFLLVTIGNAFHRMQREVVAANVFRWLRPGGWLALVWGGSPWEGEQAWQAALRAVMARWRDRVTARTGDRIPAGYEQARQTLPTWRSSAPPGSRSRPRRPTGTRTSGRPNPSRATWPARRCSRRRHWASSARPSTRTCAGSSHPGRLPAGCGKRCGSSASSRAGR